MVPQERGLQQQLLLQIPRLRWRRSEGAMAQVLVVLLLLLLLMLLPLLLLGNRVFLQLRQLREGAKQRQRITMPAPN